VARVSVAIHGQPVDVPGLRTLSFLDAGGPKHCAHYYPRGHALVRPLRQIVMHTTGGIRDCGGLALDGTGMPAVAAGESVDRFAIYYSKPASRKASAHLWVGERGTVLCTADLACERTWHATASNPASIGIEITERPDGRVYAESVRAAAALAAWLCDRFEIPRRIPTLGPKHCARVMPRATSFRGVIGHRNVVGKHDPGDAIFDALLAAGFEGVDPDAAP
jgi:hypothetical protein